MTYKKHPVATRFLPVLIKVQRTKRLRIANWPDIQRIIREIESVLPSKDVNKPQLEYPWAGPDGKINCPADLQIVQNMTNPHILDAVKMIKFIDYLHKNFDALTA